MSIRNRIIKSCLLKTRHCVLRSLYVVLLLILFIAGLIMVVNGSSECNEDAISIGAVVFGVLFTALYAFSRKLIEDRFGIIEKSCKALGLKLLAVVLFSLFILLPIQAWAVTCKGYCLWTSLICPYSDLICESAILARES